jgi:hypothetical protein
MKKYMPDDLIYQPVWDKQDHNATFYCPACKAPYYDHTEWGGDDRWLFDCVVCKKQIYVIRKETISNEYAVELYKDIIKPEAINTEGE